MRHSGRIVSDRATDIQYHQFDRSRALRTAMTVAGILTWPVVLPVALLSRLSDFIFATFSQLFALVPYVFGTIVRFEFYRFCLRRCGKNVMIGFGTVFIYRDVAIGDNVLIGMYNTIHHVDFGSYVLTAEGCRFLSGPNYHRFDRTDVPMALQGGTLRRIVIEDDVWVGANAVVMNDLGQGSIVGAGSVVVDKVEPFTIAAGVPCRPIRSRKDDGREQTAERAESD